MEIRNVKLFPNNNEEAFLVASELSDKLKKHGYTVVDSNYDLAIAIGGDGSYLRMVRDNNFNSDVYYIGVNTGTLGFLQEIKPSEVDLFLDRLGKGLYKFDNVGIQNTRVIADGVDDSFKSLNEITIRNSKLYKADFRVDVDGALLEHFSGDGLVVCTTIGSTAYNRNLGGAIIYRGFNTLQLTPIAGDSSKAFRSLLSPVVFPEDTKIEIVPEGGTKDVLIFNDGVECVYEDVRSVETTICKKKIKCLRMDDYNYPKIIREKFLD